MSIKELLYTLEGKRGKKSDPKEWGRVVYKNDDALQWSQDHHVRGGRGFLFILLAIYIPLIILVLLTFTGAGILPSMLMILLLPSLLIFIQLHSNRIQQEADQLPVVYEHGILSSSATNVYLIRIFMPYEELKSIVRKKEWVYLYPRRSRGKYTFRIEELGEQGYEILLRLFDGTYSVEESPKLFVYTEGGHVTSAESGD